MQLINLLLGVNNLGGDMQGVISPGNLKRTGGIPNNTHISPGIPGQFSAFLSLGNSWYSPAGAFRLTLQALDGNLVLSSLLLDLTSIGPYAGNITGQVDPKIDPNRLPGRSKWVPIWSAGIQAKGAKEVDMQIDGNLVAYTGSTPGSPHVWDSGTEGHENAVLIVQDDGNLVIYDTLNQPVQSRNNHMPTNTSAHESPGSNV